MRIDIYVTSKVGVGALTKSFFKKSFEWLSALPKTGTIVPLSTSGDHGLLKYGVVTDVRCVCGSTRVLLATETPTKDLREVLTSDGWEATLSFLD